jgi:hypothetical protein
MLSRCCSLLGMGKTSLNFATVWERELARHSAKGWPPITPCRCPFRNTTSRCANPPTPLFAYPVCFRRPKESTACEGMEHPSPTLPLVVPSQAQEEMEEVHCTKNTQDCEIKHELQSVECGAVQDANDSARGAPSSPNLCVIEPGSYKVPPRVGGFARI